MAGNGDRDPGEGASRDTAQDCASRGGEQDDASRGTAQDGAEPHADEPWRPIVDGHNDALLSCYGGGRDGGRPFLERADEGHLDLPRARRGGLGVGVFAAFVPNEERIDDRSELPPAVDPTRAREETAAMQDLLDRWAGRPEVRKVETAADLQACLDGDVLGAVAHLEGAAAVRPDLSNLDRLYDRGVRSIGVVWSRPNAFGTGVPMRHPATPDVGPGLTPEGERLVEACNERGIVLDCAHLNAAGFRDLADLTADPIVVSHAGAHAVAPSSRNLTDDQLRTVAASGGVVGITFAVTQLHPDGERDRDLPLSTLVDHVEHVAAVAGIDHVALGSDFDGCTVPDAVGDATGLPDVFAALRDRGFDDAALAKIARENWVRVLRETWA